MNKAAQEFTANAVAKLVAEWKAKNKPLPCFAAFANEMRHSASMMAWDACLNRRLVISNAKSSPIHFTHIKFLNAAFSQLVKELNA